MKRNANRQTAVSANDGFNPDEKENIKRISLAFNKVGNLLLQLHPLFDHVALLSSLTDKAKAGHFFCKIGYSGDILPADAEQSLISVHGVRWQMIIEELNAGYATSFGMSPEVGTIVLPEEIVDEISYEFERQDLEVQKENKRFLTQKRLSESKGLAQKRLDESKVKTKKLLELNDQPLFPGCWRKEAFAPRVYVEKLQEYKGASCIEPREQRDLQQQLRTSLAGFQGPAYNYDDHDLTERWMNSFEDSTGSIVKASEDEIIRTQTENLMENILGQVQDDVCNANHVLTATPPLGLGPAMVEREVWGIDCHTRRMLELILSEKLALIHVVDQGGDGVDQGGGGGDEAARRTSSSSSSIAGNSDGNKRESEPAVNDNNDNNDNDNETTNETTKVADSAAPPKKTITEEIEQVEKVITKNKLVTKFLEKTLLPAINAVPEAQAHKMDEALKYIIKSPRSSALHTKYAEILLDAMVEYADTDEHFRIHPKGTGVICTAPEGIAPHVVITDYLGEMYPPYRWCEKLEIIERAQREYDLKPGLPEFHNILLERPRKDENGYGLIFVDASQRGNMGSTCSHSCDANCTSAVVARDGQLVIVLTTNRYVHPGEELCMDYFSVTSSEVEWRSAICLCGSVCCRGSFLHLATQDDLQQVLNQKCGPLYRVASLLRACSDKPLTEKDSQTLQLHGMGKYALGGNLSQWMQKYAAETLRFVEFERQALPCALIRQSAQAHATVPKGKKTKEKKTKTDGGGDKVDPGSQPQPQPQLSFTAADMEARSVMEQRLQSLVCCCSMVSKFLSVQNESPSECVLEAGAESEGRASTSTTATATATPPPPMYVMSTQDAIDAVWQVLQPLPRLMHRHMLQLSTLEVAKTAPTKAKAKAPKKKTKPAAGPAVTVAAAAAATGAAVALTQNQDEEKALSSQPPQLLLNENVNPGLNPTVSVSVSVGEPLPLLPSQGQSPSEGTPLDSTNILAPSHSPSSPTHHPPSTSTLLQPTSHDPVPSVPTPSSPSAAATIDPNVTRIETAIAEVKVILSSRQKPKTLAELRERIGNLQHTLSLLHDLASPTARLRLLTDILSMWKNTTNFVRVQEFKNVESGPIEVAARELASTTINKSKYEEIRQRTVREESSVSVEVKAETSPSSKIDDINTDYVIKQEDTKTKTTTSSSSSGGSDSMDVEDAGTMIDSSEPVRKAGGRGAKRARGGGGGEGAKRSRVSNGASKAATVELGPNDVVYTGTKQYSSMFAFWQLIGWYYAGTDQEAISPDLFGTCMLPTPSVCFGEAEDSYSSSKREQLYEHLCSDKSQAMPWPADIRKCFTTKLQSTDITAASILGSPVLDTHLGQVDAIDTCLDEMFGAARKKKPSEHDDAFAGRGRAGGQAGKQQQLDGILPPEENTGWVQCDSCMQWRRVPWNVNMDDLPDEWYCKDNFWDPPDRATCETAQDQFNPDKESTVFDVVSAPEPCELGDLKDVFCMRNEVFYEAKVVALREIEVPGEQEKIKQARFHFKGWKKNTDEWLDVDSSRITPHHRHTDVTAKNPREQEKWQGRKNLVKQAKSGAGAAAGAGAGGRGGKRKDISSRGTKPTKAQRT